MPGPDDRRAPRMTADAERPFWAALEFRICRELQGFADRSLRSMWCDGLIPEEYDLAGSEPSIRGRAHCGPSGQETWRFTLLLGPGAKAVGDIDWSSLLPADDMTGWLSLHPRDRALVIDPFAAYSDP